MKTSETKPELCTVEQLFCDGAVYSIPIYQRNYAWQAEQIRQLIDDIQDTRKSNYKESYFVGNLMVTKRVEPMACFEVIDGQQRLTTLHMLLTVLRNDGQQPSAAHQNSLRYESRQRATETLRQITFGTASSPEFTTSEDTGIREGFKAIRQYIHGHDELRHQPGRDAFADFLRKKVTLVRASLPPETDLNRYFEIMNTRGQQLKQVDIIKARLMEHLPDNERPCFAWIWDACANMDSYVQMSLTRGETEKRQKIFGKDWSWLKINNFDDLLKIHQKTPSDSETGTASLHEPRSLDEALAHYATASEPAHDEDPESGQFRSTIDFPVFLLHVLKVMHHSDDENENEGMLDDKRLIKRFDEEINKKTEEKAQWVRNFGVKLLKLRNLFDGFVLKRQYTANNGEDGEWSLKRFCISNSGDRASYINTFSQANTESDGDIDQTTEHLLIIQSMLRITYTSPRNMHWITEFLKLLNNLDPDSAKESEIGDFLRNYAREKLKESFFGKGKNHRTGFGIGRIVFTYLDYLLLLEQKENKNFRFTFRNSIEHFFPQNPVLEQSIDVNLKNKDRLGNLALISVSNNAKFSNHPPKVKADAETIVKQSPKLQRMAEITRKEGWGDKQVTKHHIEMVKLLRKDVRTRRT